MAFRGLLLSVGLGPLRLHQYNVNTLPGWFKTHVCAYETKFKLVRTTSMFKSAIPSLPDILNFDLCLASKPSVPAPRTYDSVEWIDTDVDVPGVGL